MARVQAYHAIDMGMEDTWYGEVESFDSTTIRIQSGDWAGTYQGSFFYSRDGDVYGTLSSYTHTFLEETWYAITGIERDVNMFQRYTELDDGDGALSYLMSGDDRLEGSFEIDTLLGLGGDDRLFGNAGGDRLHGGGGNDLARGGPGGDRLFGGNGNDRLAGNAGLDRLHGQSGDDRLFGGTGQDRLFGNAGNDRLVGGGGGDRLHGGDGNDLARGGPGWDRLFGGNGNDRLLGNAGNDKLHGQNGNDRLFGHSGNDRLAGGGGDDRAFGGIGADRIFGGSGEDRLVGFTGRDRLNGGDGDDVLTGGRHADTFVFRGAFGDDTVTDFSAALRGETIDLSGVRSIRGFDDLVSNHLRQQGDDAVIADRNGNTVTLLDVEIADLGANDFVF